MLRSFEVPLSNYALPAANLTCRHRLSPIAASSSTCERNGSRAERFSSCSDLCNNPKLWKGIYLLPQQVVPLAPPVSAAALCLAFLCWSTAPPSVMSCFRSASPSFPSKLSPLRPLCLLPRSLSLAFLCWSTAPPSVLSCFRSASLLVFDRSSLRLILSALSVFFLQ